MTQDVPLHRRSAGVHLLGPQSDDGTHAGRVLSDLGVRGPVALISAGWQEREPEDEALVAALGVPAVNLRLHARSEALFASDPEFANAYKARQERLRHLQAFYRIRLEAADDASHAIAVRHVEPALIDEELAVSLALLRHIDGDHVERCRAVHREFNARWGAERRPARDAHLAELRTILEGAQALVITGGHVTSLLNRVRLFEVLDLARHIPIIAWSAGAMILTERIVIFHDYPPYGKDIAQILDVGYGLARGVVVLPDPRRRLRLEDEAGISRFTRRMAPALCVALDHGAELQFPGLPVSQPTPFAELGVEGMRGRGWMLGLDGAVNREWHR